MNREKIFKIVSRMALVILVPLVISYFLSFYLKIPAFSLNREDVVSYFVSLGPQAALIYIFLEIVSVLVVPIPSAVLATVGGVIFDFKLAVIYTAIALTIGTSINFYLTRIFGRLFLKKLLNDAELKQIDKFSNNIGWKFIFFSWLIPGGIADVAGYAAGLTKIPYLKYLTAALPSAFVFALFTSAAGAAISISPILTTIITFGAIAGILVGFKAVFIYGAVRKLFSSLKRRS